MERLVTKFITEPFQIRKPFKFANTKAEPIGEITQGFDNGKRPALSGCHRLHVLRFREPFGNRDFVAIFRAGLFEAWIVKQESNDITMAWTRPSGEGFDIAPR